MGAGIVLFVWLFIAAIGIACWSGALAVFLVGRRRQSRVMMWAGGAPLALGSLLGLLLVGVTIREFVWNSRPANIYQLKFGVAPSPDVTELQSKNFAFADSATTFLKFKATPATIRDLTAKQWRALSNKDWQEEDFIEFRDNGAPDWWKPSKTRTTQMYVANERFGRFGLENEVLIYESATRQTYYAFVGID